VIVVPEVLRPSGVPVAPRPARSQGLRLISVGRIAPVKGTQDLMRALVRLRVPATLDLVGLAEDESYAASVRRVAANLPDHVTVKLGRCSVAGGGGKCG
jgi:glycosyltransferase involved in cell wall biosynthesis